MTIEWEEPEGAETMGELRQGFDEALDVSRRANALQRLRDLQRSSASEANTEGQAENVAEAAGESEAASASPSPQPDLTPAPLLDPEGEEDRGFMRSIGSGLINAPGNIIGAGFDAARESLDMLGDIEEAMGSLPAGIVWDPEEGLRLASGEEMAGVTSPGDLLAEAIPAIGDAEDQDSVVRGISKFLFGFAAGGRALKGTQLAQRLASSGMAGQSALAALQGAVADFAVMDETENPVDGLLDAFPALRGPVTEFLASDPTDTDLEARMRNSLAGAGLGALADGVMVGLRGLRGLRRGRRGVEQASESVEGTLKRIRETNATQREEFNALLGDVDGPAFRVERAPGAAPDDGGEVFINWARVDSEDDVRGMLNALAQSDATGITAAQRGVRSHVDTEAAANEMGNAFDVLMSRAPEGTLNAEQQLAGRKLWAASGAKALELARAAQDPNASLTTQAAFRKQLAVHSMIQRQLLGARTEAARAVNSWRIPAGDDFQFLSQIETLVAETERGVPTHRMAENLITLHAMGDMAAADTFMYGNGWVNRFARGAEKASNMLRQWWYFSLLSRVTTHVRNTVGNTTRVGMELMDRRVASQIGELTGDANVPLGEATALMHGQVQGLKSAMEISARGRQSIREAGKLVAARRFDEAASVLAENPEDFGTFWRSAATGDSGFGIGKVDSRAAGAFSDEVLGYDPQQNWTRALQAMDLITTTPTRALAAGDEVYKAINFHGELHAQAFRKGMAALDAGDITADELPQFVAHIRNDPDEALRLLARDAAQRNTFTNDPGNGRIWKAAKAVSQVPVIGRIMLPFSRTPYNIANEALRRSPMGALMPSVWQDMAAGGARADLAWSRLLTGNMMLLGMADLALNGDLETIQITGENPRVFQGEQGRTALQRRLDVNRMTVRVNMGDGETMQIPYRGFEPITFPVALATNLVEIMDHEQFNDPNAETENLLIASSAAIGNQLSSANYMRGMTEAFSFWNDPARYGKSYFQQLVKSMVPGGVSQFVTSSDPYYRQTNDLWDAFVSQIPLASSLLYPKRQMWGEPIERNATGVFGSIMPYTTAANEIEPIDNELERLQKFPANPGAVTSFPVEPGNTDRGTVRINLRRFPEAWDRYQELQGHALKDPLALIGAGRPPLGYLPEGRGLKEELNAIVTGVHGSSAEYEMRGDGEDGGKAEFIQAIINYYRRAARVQLLEDFPEIRAEVTSREDEAGAKWKWQQEQKAERLRLR